jgi:hypothetical protein
LSCLLLVAGSGACSGRSSLNDFANGSTDTVKGNGSKNGGGANTPGGDDAGGANGTDDDGGDSNGNGGNGNGGNDGNDGNGNAGPQGRGIGEPCTDAEQCAGRGATCLEELSVFNGFLTIEFPGGYCAQADCEEDSDCPEGALCFSSIPNQTFCAKACDGNSDCRTREGYTCDTAPLSQEQTTYCLPPINFPGGAGGQGTTR